MADNPLIGTPEREQAIRTRARELWEADGRPPAGESAYRERAELLVRMEESQGAAQLPNPETQHELIPGVTVEEAGIQENYGEFPDRFADQGEWRQTPMTREELREYEQGRMPVTRGDAP